MAAGFQLVWNYGHMTIPRVLRDIVVTEYGIANLRSKSDRNHRGKQHHRRFSFQPDLLATAKSAGNLNDYEIPERYRNNTQWNCKPSLNLPPAS
jgi:acyl-CoA hydrolase